MLNKSKNLCKICLFETFFLSIVKSPVQKSGAEVRLIRRSMSGSVQLKNLGLKSLTTLEASTEGLKSIFNAKIIF